MGLPGVFEMLYADRVAKRDFSRQAHHAEAQSAKQMAFQERMSNTAYQRAMADMKKAGLNPILAGKLGGATTPGGAMAKTPQINTMDTISKVSSSVSQMAQMQQQLATAKQMNIKAQMDELDLRMLKDRNMAPLAFKHTVLNQAGSELYDFARSPTTQFFSADLLSNIMKDPRNTKLHSIHKWLEKVTNSAKKYIKDKGYFTSNKGKIPRITIYPSGYK